MISLVITPDDAGDVLVSSPLWLVPNEPHVNDLVSYLDAMRCRIAASPDETHVFEFSRATR